MSTVSIKAATPLGDLLRLHRKRLDLSQQEVGDAVGLSRSGYEALENGRVRSPSISTLKALAATLNIPMTDVVVAVGLLTTDQADPFTTLEQSRVLQRELDALAQKVSEFQARSERHARSVG